MNPAQHERNSDLARLLERVDGAQELLTEIIQIFLEEGPQLLDSMRSALEQGDAAVLAQCAHSMKGAVGNFLANEAADNASRLEKDAQSGDLRAARTSLAKLERNVKDLDQELRDVSRRLRNEDPDR